MLNLPGDQAHSCRCNKPSTAGIGRPHPQPAPHTSGPHQALVGQLQPSGRVSKGTRALFSPGKATATSLSMLLPSCQHPVLPHFCFGEKTKQKGFISQLLPSTNVKSMQFPTAERQISSLNHLLHTSHCPEQSSHTQTRTLAAHFQRHFHRASLNFKARKAPALNVVFTCIPLSVPYTHSGLPGNSPVPSAGYITSASCQEQAF